MNAFETPLQDGSLGPGRLNAEKSLTVPLYWVRMCHFPVLLPEYCPILQCLNLSDANSVIYKWVPLRSSR